MPCFFCLLDLRIITNEHIETSGHIHAYANAHIHTSVCNISCLYCHHLTSLLWMLEYCQHFAVTNSAVNNLLYIISPVWRYVEDEFPEVELPGQRTCIWNLGKDCQIPPSMVVAIYDPTTMNESASFTEAMPTGWVHYHTWVLTSLISRKWSLCGLIFN